MTLTMDIPVEQLVEDPSNVRTEFEGIAELAKSIGEVGLLQPLTVTPLPDKRYLVIDGNRRLRALQKLNGTAPTTALCVLRQDASESEITLEQLITGLQRSDLTPLDQANGFAKALGFGMTQKDLAAKLGYAPAIVKARLNLLSLPDEWAALYIRDCGIAAAAELGAALAKVPLYDLTDFEVPETDADTEYAADDWAMRITPDEVIREGAEIEARAQACELRTKILDAGGRAFVDGVDDLPDISAIEVTLDEVPSWKADRLVQLTKAELTKVRKSEHYYSVFQFGSGWNDKHQIGPKVERIEYIDDRSALPEAKQPKPVAKSPPMAPNAQSPSSINKEAESKAKAEARKLIKAQVKEAMNAKLTQAQRDDILWLGCDMLIEHVFRGRNVCDLLGIAIPEGGGPNMGVYGGREQLMDAARSGEPSAQKLARDRVILAIVLEDLVNQAKTSNSPADVLPAVRTVLDQLVPRNTVA